MLKSWQIKFCTTLDLCYSLSLYFTWPKKWKKGYFWLKITFLGPKNLKSFGSMAIFLLIVVENWGFWTSISSLKTTNIWFYLAKDQKMTNTHTRIHMVCSHFFGRFWAQYNKYGTYWRLAFTFYKAQDFNSYVKIMSGTWRPVR